ncbi:MAG: adenylate/guanylate cyclase domain-containing protein [Hyphomicrobiales bacterium]
MIADVVGYSRLMEADEVDTLNSLRRRRKEILEPLVKQHNGRVIKFMGDGVLVEFSSALNAVKCAFEIQERMRLANEDIPVSKHIILRVGINLGDVVQEGADIFGDGVNIAARLEALSQPGGICIAGSVNDAIAGKFDQTFVDLGDQVLKNISRPVRAYRSSSPGGAVGPIPRPNFENISVAVLPFNNMSGDPDQEYFADGLTEDIITALAKSKFLAVLSRNATFQYKGRAVNIPAVGKELGARYVVEGSVRSGGGRLRVTAQLIDAKTGTHVWAEKFDRNMTDVFTVQDEIVAALSGQLASSLIDAAAFVTRTVPVTNLTAYDHVLRGRSEWRKGNVQETYRHWMSAISSDPNYATALASLAFLHAEDIWIQALGIELDHLDALAHQYAERAVANDDGDAYTHHMVGTAYMACGELELAQQHLEVSITLNPYFPNPVINLGWTKAFMGQHEEGLALIEKAFGLEPRLAPAMRAVPFAVHCLMGAVDAALKDLAKIEHPYAFLSLWMAGSLSFAGRNDEATKHLAAFERDKSPNFNVAGFVRMTQRCMYRADDRDRFVSGFRTAELIA